MSKPKYYHQCKLQRGNSTLVSWLPERYARFNKIVKLKQEDGSWENGWRVMKVFKVKWEGAFLEQYSNSYKHQRKVSDI